MSSSDLEVAVERSQHKTAQLSDAITRDLALYLFVKRVMDVVLSSIGLILLLPLFILISIWIKLDDWKGPVFF